MDKRDFHTWPRIWRLIYFAAFFDGEGSIGIYKMKPKKIGWNIHYGIRMNIVNTDRTAPSYFEKEFGMKSWLSTYTPKEKQRKPVYQWACTGKTLKKVITDIYPYVGQKKKQLDCALSFLKYKEGIYKKHMNSPMTDGGFENYSEEEIENLEKFYIQMKQLKHE